ncbi:AtpZ/AtpI family protein [Mucilaginibacter ximonensis]|uniref:AtpZ/AtpI family protein n=1 Tax=Mucilaginibacter ximonensis TaxID=538021 RepID=A0ABW5YEH2_9SPHI
MAKTEQDNGAGNKNTVTNYARFMGMAFQMLVIIGLFTFAGYKIDQSAGHDTKWVTATLALVGVFIALFIVIRSIKN